MRLLFVCTGNTCRSPMAEVIARRLIAERGLEHLQASSAGTSAWVGAAASDGALLVALEHGLDLSEHRARLLTRELVAESDLVLTMGPPHLDRAESLGGTGRSFLLTTYATGDSGYARPISDPFGGELDVYRETFVELTQEISAVLDRLASDPSRPSI